MKVRDFRLPLAAPQSAPESAQVLRRRRIVVVITLVAGAVLLGFSLSVRPGATSFYALTGALAAVWAVGGVVSGPLHLGMMSLRGHLRRPVVTPIATGVLIAAVFIAGALIVREIAPLRDITDSVLAHARQGWLPLIFVVTLINGVAEEIFFRGALYAALAPRGQVVLSTLVYAAVTAATGNAMLVFAAAVLGIVLALQRQATGGILASTLTHVTWSAIMLLALPPVLAG